MTLPPPIPRGTDCCLFLDIDGTLLEYAPTPDQVHVGEPLRDLLRGLDRHCNGAVAFVSGRAIVDIDDLFEPLYLAAAGIHGCERRDALGHWRREPVDASALGEVRTRLTRKLQPFDGVWIEDKGCALAVHFREAQHFERPLRGALAGENTHLPSSLEILQGDCVIEIKPRGFNKASAIEAFMREAPFAGRMPVFIGDDRTDEDGFRAVHRLNGMAIAVGDRAHCEWRLPGPSAVRRWLENFLLRT